MSDSFTKIVRLGHTQGIGSTFCKIEFNGSQLSISGVEGPTSGGNCKGSCGQILHDLTIEDYALGWTNELVKEFTMIWERWHLNYMKAGTLRQRAVIAYKVFELLPFYPELQYAPHSVPSKLGFDSYYSMCCAWLKDAGLYVDEGHIYGHAWLFEPIPDHILDFLKALSDADIKPPWV
jgi:hypothetical protein